MARMAIRAYSWPPELAERPVPGILGLHTAQNEKVTGSALFVFH